MISRLENDEYGKVSVQTLLDVAQAVDVALLVQFVSYPDFLERMRDKSPAGMVPENITESTARMKRAVATEALLQTSGQERQTARHDFGRSSGPLSGIARSLRNRDEKFNSAGSALMRTEIKINQIIRQPIQ